LKQATKLNLETFRDKYFLFISTKQSARWYSNLLPTGLRTPTSPETILTQLQRIHYLCLLYFLPLSTHCLYYLSRKVSNVWLN